MVVYRTRTYVRDNEIDELTPQYLKDWAKGKETNYLHQSTPAIPLSREQMSKGLVETEMLFETHLMGGLMLLKDPKDLLSVMLGITNLLTAFLLLSTTLLLGQSWIEGESSGYLPLIGSILSLTACAALVIETLLADEKLLVKRIRRRARPIQYAILISGLDSMVW